MILKANFSKLSTKSKLGGGTDAYITMQSLTTGLKEAEASTRENSDLLHKLNTQIANDATRLEAIIKRVDELKSEKSVKSTKSLERTSRIFLKKWIEHNGPLRLQSS